MDQGVVNSVLLVVVLPVLAWLAVTLLKLNHTLTRLDTALTGYDGKGGVLNDLRAVRGRVHRLESIASALLVHTGIEIPPEIQP